MKKISFLASFSWTTNSIKRKLNVIQLLGQCYTASEIFGICLFQFLVDEIAPKFINKIYIIRNNNVDAILVHTAQ